MPHTLCVYTEVTDPVGQGCWLRPIPKSSFHRQGQWSSERVKDLFNLLRHKVVELRFKSWFPDSQPVIFPRLIYTTFHQQYLMYSELLFSALKMNLQFSTSYSIMYIVIHYTWFKRHCYILLFFIYMHIEMCVYIYILICIICQRLKKQW